MTEEEILAELRTIRTLLAIEKEDRLTTVVDDLDEKQLRILEELSFEEWRRSGEFQSEIADEFGVTNETIRRKKVDLVEKNLLIKKGINTGTEYKKSGLARAAGLVTDL